MLVRDPRKRITPQQALCHPWLIRFSSSSSSSSSSPSSSPSGEQVPMEVEKEAEEGKDKTERLGGCVLRSQYGSPLCVVS